MSPPETVLRTGGLLVDANWILDQFGAQPVLGHRTREGQQSHV